MKLGKASISLADYVDAQTKTISLPLSPSAAILNIKIRSHTVGKPSLQSSRPSYSSKQDLSSDDDVSDLTDFDSPDEDNGEEFEMDASQSLLSTALPSSTTCTTSPNQPKALLGETALNSISKIRDSNQNKAEEEADGEGEEDVVDEEKENWMKELRREKEELGWRKQALEKERQTLKKKKEEQKKAMQSLISERDQLSQEKEELIAMKMGFSEERMALEQQEQALNMQELELAASKSQLRKKEQDLMMMEERLLHRESELAEEAERLKKEKESLEENSSRLTQREIQQKQAESELVQLKLELSQREVLVNESEANSFEMKDKLRQREEEINQRERQLAQLADQIRARESLLILREEDLDSWEREHNNSESARRTDDETSALRESLKLASTKIDITEFSNDNSKLSADDSSLREDREAFKEQQQKLYLKEQALLRREQEIISREIKLQEFSDAQNQKKSDSTDMTMIETLQKEISQLKRQLSANSNSSSSSIIESLKQELREKDDFIQKFQSNMRVVKQNPIHESKELLERELEMKDVIEKAIYLPTPDYDSNQIPTSSALLFAFLRSYCNICIEDEKKVPNENRLISQRRTRCYHVFKTILCSMSLSITSSGYKKDSWYLAYWISGICGLLKLLNSHLASHKEDLPSALRDRIATFDSIKKQQGRTEDMTSEGNGELDECLLAVNDDFDPTQTSSLLLFLLNSLQSLKYDVAMMFIKDVYHRLDSVIERTFELLACNDPLNSDDTKRKLKKAEMVNAVLHDSLFNMEIHHLSRTVIEEIFHQVYSHLNAVLFNYIIKHAHLYVSSASIPINTNSFLSVLVSYWSTPKAQVPYLFDIARERLSVVCELMEWVSGVKLNLGTKRNTTSLNARQKKYVADAVSRTPKSNNTPHLLDLRKHADSFIESTSSPSIAKLPLFLDPFKIIL